MLASIPTDIPNIYIYIYIYREREREDAINICKLLYLAAGNHIIALKIILSSTSNSPKNPRVDMS